MSYASMKATGVTLAGPELLIARGKSVLRAEMGAIELVCQQLDQRFARAVELLLQCRGTVVVAGMGKAGIVGKKLAASLSSTGTPSYFLHPAEAVHGDLGSIRDEDVVILLSYSGETEEITRLLAPLKETAATTIAITAHERSCLARNVTLALFLGMHREACGLGLAPSCTTTAMLALGDALTLVLSEQRGFTREQFAKYHPAGSLGKQLTRVEEVMRPLSECRVAPQSKTVRQILIHVGRAGRRTGAIMLCDSTGKLTGLFTDSDLARLMESSHESRLEHPIAEVMTQQFQTIGRDALLPEAVHILATRKISELPVVDDDFMPIGILDITDLVSLTKSNWSPSPLPVPSELKILPISAPQ